MIKNDIISKQLEALDKLIPKSIQKQVKLYEAITKTIPPFLLNEKNISRIKIISQFQNEINLINNTNLKSLSKHKSNFSYHKHSLFLKQYYPNFEEIIKLTSNLKNLDLNLPLSQLKKLPSWKSFLMLENSLRGLRRLCYLSNIDNSILLLKKEIIDIETFKKQLSINKNFIFLYQYFRDSELGSNISQEIFSLPDIAISEKEEIIYLIFLGLIISFYYTDLGITFLNHLLNIYIFLDDNNFFKHLDNVQTIINTIRTISSVAPTSIPLEEDNL
ncbi:hypothetical protein [Cetobacterium somerae]